MSQQVGVAGAMATVANVQDAARPRWLVWFRRYGPIVGLYLIASWMTGAHFMGDTVGYAEAIQASRLVEFGHLLWYSLGWLLAHAFTPFGHLWPGLDARTTVIVALMAMSWLAGLLSVLALHAVVRMICRREWVANVGAIGLLVSQGFLNYAQSGCSYVPGVSLLLSGLYLALRGAQPSGRSPAWGWAAGLAWAGAVGLWFPYVLTIPAAMAAPLLVFGVRAARWRVAGHSAVAFALAAALLYGSAALAQGIHTVGGIKAWVASAQHGITGMNGVRRTVFGLPRSFIYMGADGMMLKRFLVHDPLNPVSLADLFRLSLWKLCLFYLLLGSMVVVLARSTRGRRFLALLVLTAVPLLTFAVLWEAGAIERYVPLYPAFFVALAYGLASSRSAVFRLLVLAFLVAATMSSAQAMATSVLTHRLEEMSARIGDLQPLWKPASVVATVHQQDEVWAFYWSFPFHPINRSGAFAVYHVVEPGTTQVLEWRRHFASLSRSVWERGGDVWVSKRLLAARPRSEWNWVEGDDARVSWADLHGFFARLEMSRSVGGEDGFALLSTSAANSAVLQSLEPRAH